MKLARDYMMAIGCNNVEDQSPLSLFNTGQAYLMMFIQSQ